VGVVKQKQTVERCICDISPFDRQCIFKGPEEPDERLFDVFGQVGEWSLEFVNRYVAAKTDGKETIMLGYMRDSMQEGNRADLLATNP